MLAEIFKATKESLGYKPIQKKTWISTCNEELKQIIEKENMNIKYIYKLKAHNTLYVTNFEQKLEN
jgi:hypothetical protein